ncbi:MAG: class I SAM-dependent methyltransferase [Verrucomicrobia bacterium]|nr:class I SAM-dependent methyltransferase [Verrucomicrobiota bacterium]
MKDEFYHGLDAEFYDELLDGEIDDLPFWRALLKTNSGPSLEVGCGTGRVLLPLLQEGFAIDGMDRSAKMIDLLNEKAGKLGVEVDVRIQPMEALNMGKTYPLIFIPGFSLQMVASRELLKESLHCFHAHLESGGQLAISLFFPWEELEVEGSGDWHLRKKIKRPDGSRLECHQSTQINTEDQSLVVKNRYTLLDKHRKRLGEELRDIRLLWFYPHEFHLLLEETGYHLLETYADFEYEPMDEFTPYAVFLAEKAGT